MDLGFGGTLFTPGTRLGLEGVGQIIVHERSFPDEVGSTLSTTELILGPSAAGVGVLEIRDGGHVTAQQTRIGLLGGGQVTVSSQIPAWRAVFETGELSADHRAVITVGANSVMTSASAALTGGTFVTLSGGPEPSWDIAGDLAVGDANGTATVELCPSAALQVGGSINVAPGSEIRGDGAIRTPGGSLIEGVLAPGCSPGTLTIEGSYEQTETGVLVIEIAGSEPGQFDVLNVRGNVTLGGTLELHFVDGIRPSSDLSVPFLKVGGTLAGTFNNIVATQDGEPADVVLETTLDETGQLRVRSAAPGQAELNPAALDQAALDQTAPACGAGLCGAGAAPLLPLTLLSLAGIKFTRRNQQRLRWATSAGQCGGRWAALHRRRASKSAASPRISP